jgi:integrase/recombinase XerC
MIDQFLDHLDRQGKSNNTIASYHQALKHFVKWFELSNGSDTFSSSKVIPRDVRDWLSYQQTNEIAAPSTINQRLTALRKYFDWCVSFGLISNNPATEFRYKKVKKQQPKALSKADVRNIMRVAYSDGRGVQRDITILELMLNTGLRREEVLNLLVSDITISDRKGSVLVRDSKTGESRSVPLNSKVRSEFEKYFTTFDPPLKPSDPLWWGQRGPLKNLSTINKIVNKYATRAGLNTTPHQFRHTLATRYLEANPGEIRRLAEILGHSSLDTTMIYTVPSDDDLSNDLERTHV